MQNIHTHAWDRDLHFAELLSDGEDTSPKGLFATTVHFDPFIKDMLPFDKVVVFGMKAKLVGVWVPDQFIADFVAKDPAKLVGFVSCDPTQEGYMEELKYGVESLHLCGVKMAPMYAGFDPRDSRCDSVYMYCQENGIPILFHAGTTFLMKAPLKFSRPILFDEIAIKYPNLKIVLAHMGHPYCEECIVVIRKHPNLYTDISALQGRPWQFYNAMISVQEYRVENKLLFGTDYPFMSSIETIRRFRDINEMTSGTSLPQVSVRVMDEILERNSLNLLGI